MKNITNKKGFNTWYSILLNLLVLSLSLIFFKINYEISDDYFLSQFAVDERYDFIFINNLLMRTLCAIQSVISPINAHTVISLILAYFSMCVISKIFLDKFRFKLGTIFIVVLNSVFLVNFYLTISFTRLPGLLATAGLLSIVHYTRQNKWIFGTIVGIILTLLSSMYRIGIFELAFCMGIAFVAALSFSDFYNSENKKISKLFKIIFEPKRFISAIIVLVLAFSCDFVSNQLINSDVNTQYYREYTSLRASITDFDIPAYDEVKSDYDKLNIDENDLLLLKAGFMDEDGAFSLDNMKEILAIKNNEPVNILDIIKSMIVSEMYKVYGLSTEGVAILAVAIIFLLYYLFQKKKSIIAPILIVIAAVLGYFYFWYIGRVVLRVIITILFSAFVYLIYLYDIEKICKLKKKWHKYILVLVLSLVCILSGYKTINGNEYMSYYSDTEKTNQISQYINDNPNKKFEMARNTYFTCNMPNIDNNVFIINKSSYDNNYIQTFFTYYLSSYYYDKINGFDTNNFYNNLLQQDVYFVVNNKYDYSYSMKEYLQKYYSNGNSIQMNVVEKFDNYTVYNYTLE